MQAQSFVLQGGNAFEFTENGGEVDTQGFEAELHWVPDDNWNISATLSLMKSEFGEYNISKVAGLGDLGGRQDLNDPDEPLLSLRGYTPALSPEVTFGLSLGYDVHFAGGSVLTPFVQMNYSGQYSGFDINVPGQYQDAFTKADIRLIWSSQSGKIDAEAFVLNVGDEQVLSRVVIFNPTPTLASLQAHWDNPRTWGLRLGYNFE
jgi:outer membrane receptor protein involved in Fe transport